MDEYQKEQYDALLMVKEHLASLSAPERMKIRSALKDYLLFRDKVNSFLAKHFTQICTQKCYQNNLSACCSREGIITFFADAVINILVSEKNEIEALLKILQQSNNGFKCIYLCEQGCMWRVKPIVCEMFLCDQAIKAAFDEKPRVHQEWKSLEQERKLFTWPDKPILFDMLEGIFIDAGYHSSLMYMHNSPGLLRVKKIAQKSKHKI
jgi:hypothetical protein